MNIEKEINKLIPEENKYLVGFSDMTDLLAEKYKGFNFAVVVGKKLDDRIMDAVAGGPTLEYYRHYRQTNKILSGITHKISKKLKSLSIPNLVIEPTLSSKVLRSTYYNTLRYDFSHKMAATRAGLGWIGKTGLFISEKFGPRLRLAAILIGYPLQCSEKPVIESKCGSCKLCVEKCPARAATGLPWNIHVDRDEFFDAFKCRETCLRLTRKYLKKTGYICGICVSVCPIGRRKK